MEEPRDTRPPPPSVLSTVLLVLAGIDVALALVLLVVGGYSWQFWMIAGIGVLLGALALKERLFPREP